MPADPGLARTIALSQPSHTTGGIKRLCDMPKSCVWTSSLNPSCVPCMDQDTANLVACLYTQIGMIMEDASVIALELGGSQDYDQNPQLEKLSKSVIQIATLLATVRALNA